MQPLNGPDHGWFVSITSRLSRWCVEHPAATIIISILIALLSALFAATTLKIDTNPASMIRADLPFRQNYRDLISQFPALDNSFVIIVDAKSPETGRSVAGKIAAALKARPREFSDVFAPGTGPYFDRYGALYLDLPAVKRIAKGIDQVAPLIDTMALQPDIAGLADLFQQITPVVEVGQAPPELAGFLNKIGATVDAANHGKSSALDWTALDQQASPTGEARWYVLAKPIVDFSALDPAAGPMTTVRRLIAEFDDKQSGINIQLTGEAALNAEELGAVTKSAALAGATSFVLVTLTVIVGLPSLLLVTAAISLIVLGFLINAGFAAATVGSLNMISVAFAVLFVGLGIDYAVHVILRFAEHRAKGQERKQAAIEAARELAPSLGVCTLTTSLAFLAFSLTDFVGMSQLGIIASGGVVIALIGSLTLVPAILSVLPSSQSRLAEKFSKLTTHHDSRLRAYWPAIRKVITVVIILGGIGSVFALPHVRFDGDPINLKDPSAASVIAFEDLAQHQPALTFAIQLLATPGPQMRDIVGRLKALPQVSEVESIETMIPSEQKAKLDALHAAAEFLPTSIDPAVAMSDSERRDYFDTLLESATEMAKAESASQEVRAAAARLQDALKVFISSSGGSADRMKALERSLVGGFPRLFSAVHQVATLDRVTLDTISQDIRQRYVAPDGRWRLDILAKGDMRDPAQRKAFVNAVTTIAPQATGAPVEIIGAARVVSSSMIWASLTTVVLVFVVIFAVLRRLSDVLLVVATILLAALLMVSFSVVFDAPFNFANVIVLPLLVGLGVDSALHYVMRVREQGDQLDITRTWTPRAVAISALTTIASFGTLWLSGHRGMASMGEHLTVAITITLLCTLIVLPQLICWFVRLPDRSKS